MITDMRWDCSRTPPVLQMEISYEEYWGGVPSTKSFWQDVPIHFVLTPKEK